MKPSEILMHSNAWDWYNKFISMLGRAEFVSTSGLLFIVNKLKYSN